MINLIYGLMNSGKTLYMTSKLFESWKNNNDIISNYYLNFPHFKINQDWLIELTKNEERVLKNVAFGFDELWIWLMDSRSSTSKESRIGSFFFLQSSKDDTEIYITAQNSSQNDKRLRDNCHYVTECSRVIKLGDEFHELDEAKRFLNPKLHQLLYIKAMVFKRKSLFGTTELVYSHTEFIKANNIFQLYDTSQKIIKKN